MSCPGARRQRAGPAPTCSCAHKSDADWLRRVFSGPSPSRSIAPGRYPSIRTSAFIARSRTRLRPSGDFRSTAATAGAVAIEKVELRIAAKRFGAEALFNAQDVGAQIGEQHGAKGAPTKPRKIPESEYRAAGGAEPFSFSYHRLDIRSP